MGIVFLVIDLETYRSSGYINLSWIKQVCILSMLVVGLKVLEP